MAENQPEKLAAMEGIWETEENAPAYVVGWVDQGSGDTIGIAIPGLLSFLSGADTVTGINDFEVPPTLSNLTFQSYHLMVGLGMAIVPFALLAAGLWFWKRKLLEQRWALWIVVSSVFVALFVITMGWWVAEFGRQPWIVYGLMFTADADIASGGSVGDRSLARWLRAHLHPAAGALPVPAQPQDPTWPGGTRGGRVQAGR